MRHLARKVTREEIQFQFQSSILRHFVTKRNTKRYIFWVVRHISKFLSLLTSSWWFHSETNIRYPIILKPKFGGNFLTSFSGQKCQNLKNKKPRFFWNSEFYIVAKFQGNCIKTKKRWTKVSVLDITYAHREGIKATVSSMFVWERTTVNLSLSRHALD